MVHDPVGKTVACNRIVLVVLAISEPVVAQLFGAKHKHVAVLVLVILDDRKGRKCFTETDAIGENASVELFQFVDDGKACFFLEIVKLIPDGAVLEACSLVC